MKPLSVLLLYGMLVLLAVATSTTTTTGVYAQIPPTPQTTTPTTPPIPTMPPTNQTTLETNATTTATTTTAPPISLEFEDEPFAESLLREVTENVISETQQIEVVYEGSTTITTLPNTTGTITTRDVGEGILTFIPGGSVFYGQLQMTTEDGSESATALFTEHFNEESPTAISLV